MFLPIHRSSVSDPDSLSPDLDPAFWAEWGSGSSVLMTKYWEKFTPDIFLIKNWNYSFLGFHKGRSSYRRSLHSSKENIQHFKT
jgi:hypothetical protein